MSRKDDPIAVDQNIVQMPMEEVMHMSMIPYAEHVIMDRAVPRVEDGLKPVQRRILYMMADMGLRPDRGHVKSARVVGEVMGKLHPHGDSAIYDAMVRMAQSWALRLPLIDGHGNFGSLDDGPAAARYTEARLAAPALTLTDHLDEDVVDFVPNYDNQLMQPEVLPAAFPNLLVNGTTGIAVGMATNMAPHNLGEVIAATRHLIANGKLAEATGVAAENVILADDGTVVDLRDGKARIVGAVECGFVYVDGSSVGEITDTDIKDRVILGEEGFISVITVVNRSTGTIVSGPEIHARGVAEDDAVFDEIKPKISKALEEAVTSNKDHTTHQLQQVVRRVVGTWVNRRLRRRPMIVPVVLEA